MFKLMVLGLAVIGLIGCRDAFPENKEEVQMTDIRDNEVKRITKPNGHIFFRVMCEHKHELYYPWNEKKAKQFAKEFGFTFVDGPRVIYKTIWETREKTVGDRGQERLYWEWTI